ncbi:MAG: hypothetical protein IMZ52_04780 [Actinobacteria bacterium]|nr:hypothetical protein [Actinomycetota bacterium]MBE3114781.1 hypothetical protein [Actinomycetota bacterium]
MIKIKNDDNYYKERYNEVCKEHEKEMMVAYKLVIDARRKLKVSMYSLKAILENINSLEIIDNRDNKKILIPKSNVYHENLNELMEMNVDDRENKEIIVPLVISNGYTINLGVKYPELNKKEDRIVLSDSLDVDKITLSHEELGMIEKLIYKIRHDNK